LSPAAKTGELIAVSERAQEWKLEDLVDFEQALAAPAAITDEARARVAHAARGLEGAAARRAGLRAWLDGLRPGPAGRRFTAALGLVAALFGLFAWLAGVSAMIGLWDRQLGGVNVILFLALLIGVQWLLLLLAAVGLLFRHRAAAGFTGVQTALAGIARKLAGETGSPWWRRLADGGPSSRAALGWRLARIAQSAGVAFNLGILSGLLGLVLVRNVGFFWETTTERAMQEMLESGVRWISLPWSAWAPAAVPDASVIAATRLESGLASGLVPAGPAAWWLFLLLAVFFWGLLPRGLWWLVALRAERRALAHLDFQAKHHRALWRELAGSGREEVDEKPLDGVLVLDVGGSGLTQESLRPFLLRRLRVNPTAWKSTAVLDPGAEQESAEAIARAPAGVVLLAEGWALSPPRMTALHQRIRAATPADTPLKFLVANVTHDLQPAPATPDEREQWERFVDKLRDPAAEVFFYQDPA
jgi:hypothetical protein